MVRPDDRAFDRPRVYAHRGSAVLAPENTAEAFDLALGFGADVLETDVRLCRDGEVMVTHDARLERTTDGRGAVRDHSRAALARLDAGYRFVDPEGRAARGTGVRLISLAELLERYPDTPVNVDIKDDEPMAAAAVVRTIEAASAERRVTVGSFHAATLARFREIAPGIDTAASRTEVARLYFGRLLPGQRTDAPAYRWLQIPPVWLGIPLATTAFIDSARVRGVGAVYWTINEPARMRDLFARGASGIVTDRPDLAARERPREAS